MEIVVSCRGLKKSYYTNDIETIALRGVDMEIQRGELFMLAGPSGCGKTTLISIIAGILSYEEGACTIFGRELHSLSNGELTRLRGNKLGFVFQAYNLIPTLTAIDNVSVPLLLNGYRQKEAYEKARAVLYDVGLEKQLESLPKNLSGGQQQRVAIARAIAHDPELVVCDEPTSALDKDTGHHVMELLHDFVLKKGKTLIVVTHDPRVFSFASRIGLMNDGRVEKIANSPAELDL